jgi:Tfp pilus assembly protein PilF
MLNIEQTYRTGLSHLAANRLSAAESCFRLVVSSRPDFAAGHYHLGVVFRLRRQWRAAGQAFRAAIRLAPDYARAYAGLGTILERLGQTDEAELQFRAAIARDAGVKEAQLFLADLLRAKGELGAPRAIYQTLLQNDPDGAAARFGRGFLDLLEGDLASGWKDYEFRQARREQTDPALRPQWRGEDPAAKTLLLYAEQGIGDTIQFLRYATLLARRGARVLAAVPVSVMELASRVEGIAEILQPSPVLPRFDYCVPLPSLPLYCDTTLDNIPWDGPYLSPPPGPHPPVPPNDETKRTVALAWAGNPDHPNDHNRSMAVSDIRPLLETENIRWLILQKGAGANQLEASPDIVRLGEALDNFSDIAAIMSSADLVISVDTSFCHLAGALGRPVWTLLSYAPDWRWLLHRTDTPWYPTMRLFRQATPRDWAGVITEVAQALRTSLHMK